MTDASMDSAAPKRRFVSLTAEDDRTRKRNAAEKRFRMYGIVAISIGLFFLVSLVYAILSQGLPAFKQAVVKIEYTLIQEQYDDAESKLLKTAVYTDNFVAYLSEEMNARGIEVAFDAAAIERLLGKVGGEDMRFDTVLFLDLRFERL